MSTMRRVLARGCTVATAAVTGAVLAGGGTAWADETHHGSHNGPNIALISTGQIDDPLEDVLEHAALFQRDHHTG